MKEALKLALEALINARAVRNGEGGTKLVSPLEENAITAIKEALAQPEQEPVAWFSTLPDGRLSIKIVGKPTEGNWEPLYTTPPKRPWVGLTDAPTYTEQQIANACWAAEISDSKCESLLIALQESAHNIGVNI
jgi:hypothetical protein